MPELKNINRTRLRLTIIGCITFLLILIFPSYVIIKSLNLGHYESVSAWAAWGVCITAIGTLIGYYVNQQTKRPSMFSSQIENRIPQPIKDALSKNEEDETDDNPIPL